MKYWLFVAVLLSGHSWATSWEEFKSKAKFQHNDTAFKGTRTEAQGKSEWDAYSERPREVPGGGGGGEIKEVWAGRSKTVTLPDGPGYYMITTEDESAQRKLRSGWVHITSSGRETELGFLDYGGNSAFKWVGYRNGVFSTYNGSSAGNSWIVSIAKGPSEKVAAECVAGETRRRALYCQGVGEYECGGPGLEQQTCNGGFWGTWTVLSVPECASPNTMCR